jgi:aryl-alcohol dehydrogenase-like predicted oxidoreductase
MAHAPAAAIPRLCSGELKDEGKIRRVGVSNFCEAQLREVQRVAAKVSVPNRYNVASHGFFYYHTSMYRPEAAMDGWAKVFGCFSRHLSG